MGRLKDNERVTETRLGDCCLNVQAPDISRTKEYESENIPKVLGFPLQSSCEPQRSEERRDPWDLSDDDWRLIHLQIVNASPKKKTGRPRADLRPLTSAVLWFLHHQGAQWRVDIPGEY